MRNNRGYYVKNDVAADMTLSDCSDPHALE